jgi:hypothetical protein
MANHDAATRASGDGGFLLRALLALALGFALAWGACLGVAGVATSNFTFTLSIRELLPFAGVLFIAYLMLGLVVLLVSLAVPPRPIGQESFERRLFLVFTTVSVWTWSGLMFLPLKGSETFVRAGRLTTIQLNLLGVGIIAGGGLIVGFVVSIIARALLSGARRRLPGRARSLLGAALALAAIVVLVAGASVRHRGLSELSGSGLSHGPQAVPRVVLIGVDGWTWSRLEPLLEEGRLPTLARLMDAGSYGPLTSMKPMVSPRIWTTIATGKTPDKHGIKDFVNEAGVPVNSTMRRASPIWSIVSAYGAPVGVIGWYVTWPADRVNGFMLSDRVHSLLRGPAQILQSLTGRPTNERLESFGRFSFDPAYKRLPKSDPKRVLGRIVDEPLRWGYLRDLIYGRLARLLLPLYRPTLSAVYVRGVDFVQHFFWQYSDPQAFPNVPPADALAYGPVIGNMYAYEDRILGRVLEALGDDLNVVIVSDHGFGPNTDIDPKLPERTGEHNLAGVFIASGPAFKSAGRVEGAGVLDVTPTILAVMGLPVGEDMDGRVLREIISDEHLSRYPVRFIPSYEPAVGRVTKEIGSTMDESIKEQLRSLGYIE